MRITVEKDLYEGHIKISAPVPGLNRWVLAKVIPTFWNDKRGVDGVIIKYSNEYEVPLEVTIIAEKEAQKLRGVLMGKNVKELRDWVDKVEWIGIYE